MASQPVKHARPSFLRQDVHVRQLQDPPQAGVPAGLPEATAYQRHVAQPAQRKASPCYHLSHTRGGCCFVIAGYCEQKDRGDYLMELVETVTQDVHREGGTS